MGGVIARDGSIGMETEIHRHVQCRVCLREAHWYAMNRLEAYLDAVHWVEDGYGVVCPECRHAETAQNRNEQ